MIIKVICILSVSKLVRDVDGCWRFLSLLNDCSTLQLPFGILSIKF